MVRQETINIDKGVALTSTVDFFEDLAKGKGPKNSILALGYAGWGPGQLESEIMQTAGCHFQLILVFSLMMKFHINGPSF